MRIAQPLAGLAIAPGAQQVNERPEQACIALGLALRTVEHAKIEINLIPPRVLEAARRREQIFYWSLSLATLALIMASVIPVSANENKLTLKEIETFKQVLMRYDRDIAVAVKPGNVAALPQSTKETELSGEKTKVTRMQGRAKILDDARDQRRFWMDELAFMNDTRPKTGGVWFYSVETTSVPQPGQGGQAGGPGQGKGGAAPAAAAPVKKKGGFSGVGNTRGSTSDTIGKPFPGVTPTDAALTGGGFGKRRTQGQTGAQAGPNAKKPAEEFSTTPIEKANSLMVRGIAEKPEIVKEFVDGLKKAERTLPDQRFLTAKKVFFSETNVRQVDPSVIYNLPVDGFKGQQQDNNAGFYTKPFYLFTVEVLFRVTDERPSEGAETAEAADAAGAQAGGATAGAAAPGAGANAGGDGAAIDLTNIPRLGKNRKNPQGDGG